MEVEVAARPASTRGGRSGCASGGGRALARLLLREAEEEKTRDSSFSSGGAWAASGGLRVRVGRGMSGEGLRTEPPAGLEPASSRGRGRGATCEPASRAGA